jgi:hypothetical protein
MAVNDIRALSGLQHELHCRLAEKSKPHFIIVVAIKATTLEKIILRMRLDKKALAAVNEAEPDRTGN